MYRFASISHRKAAILWLLLMVPFTVSATTVTVTLPPLAGLVHMLDDQVAISCLLPASADPHHFQLQPRKIEALKRSDLLIRASYDDGGWPMPARHANTLDLWPDKDHGWVSPLEVRGILPKIAEALIKLQPESAEQIRNNLTRALAMTATVEQQWQDRLRPLQSSGVIMQHPSWRRLMLEMNVPILNVLESGHHGHEHGPHLLDEALHQLADFPDAWLISDAGHNNRALDWLKQQGGRKLNHATLDALGECGSGWEKLMLDNLQQFSTEAQ